MGEFYVWNSPAKCEMCGKEIYGINRDTWAYKRGEAPGHYKFFCTWSCLRKYDKMKEEKRKATKPKRYR